MSIKYKIILSILIIVLFIMSLVSYSYINYAQKIIKELSITQLVSIGHITQDRLKDYLEESQEKVKLFNSNLALENALAKYLKNQNQKSLIIVKNLLNESYTENGQIQDIIILDTNGDILTSLSKKVNSISMKKMFKRSLNGSYTHISFMDDKRNPILCLAEPIYKDKLFVGTTIFKIRLDELNDMLIHREGLGETGEALLGIYNIDKDIVFFTPLRFEKYPLTVSSDNLEKTLPMRLALNKQTQDIVTDALDYRNKRVVSALHYFKPLDIGIVVKKDMKEIMRPIEELKDTLFKITLIGLLISIVISYFFSLIIIKFINNIVYVTSKISEGHLHKRINISTHDEFGLISISINQMADSLVKMNSTLEKSVELKTKQLSKTNIQLNHIFDITPNITILTDGKTIIRANNKFYQFTGYNSLEEFLKDYDCICDMFSITKGYIRPKIDGENWTDYISTHPNKTHRVIMEKDGIENLFLVKATTYIEDGNTKHIVIFENITEIQKLAYTDQLTKLSNRLKIDEVLERCVESTNRYKRDFTIILLDIDNFKKVNDTYGHLVGDEVLKTLSKILKEQIRNIDLVGRWGGEEFIIISQETDIAGGRILAEKIRKAIEAYSFEIVLKQTISLGVSQYKELDSIDDLINRADEALYKAKKDGKNIVITN